MLQARLFFRFISKNRELYALKIISLTIAFACCTLVILFSLNEFGYDRFHKESNSVFRILKRNNSESHSGNRLSDRIPVDALQQLKSFSKEAMIVSRAKVMNELSVVADAGTFHDQKVIAADTDIVSILSFDILDGSIEEFRKNKNSILLSASYAANYFAPNQARENHLKLYSFGDSLTFSVAGIYKDFPGNSHQAFKAIIRFDSTAILSLKFNPEETGVYGKIVHGEASAQEAMFNNFFAHKELSYLFQPISEIYFGPSVLGEDARHGDRYSILILTSLAGLILFLALITFINITTLTLPHRSKEIALKKLSGASQRNLLFAFAKESFALVGLSWGFSILLLMLMSDFLAPILALDFVALMTTGNASYFIIVAGLALLLGIAPLFMMIRFTKATPGRLLSSETIAFPRLKRICTILQLGTSMFLIIASIVIKRQVNYSLIKEPGRNHDQVVYISYPRALTDIQLRVLQEKWKKQNPHILDVMAVSQLPDQISSKELNSDFYFLAVDPAFKDFFNLKIQDGRWFKANDGDSLVVVNETGTKLLAKANTIGTIQDFGGQYNQPEKPLAISLATDNRYNFLCIRVLEVDIRKTVSYLSTYFNPGSTTPVSFMNKRFGEWLGYQDRLNNLSEILAIISGLLSCFAIYGLSVSLVKDKVKPIAIHKICGAGTWHITKLLLIVFGRQMLVAILIFGPLTFMIITESLRSFVYATHISWVDSLFPLAYCAIVITALCGFQALSLNRTDLITPLKG